MTLNPGEIQSPLPEHDLTGGRLIITSPYGRRQIDGVWGNHFGTDLGSDDGMDQDVLCYPVRPLKVLAKLNDGGAPSAGINLHAVDDEGTYWKYFHLHGIDAQVGASYGLDDPIARVGHSGTGANHLHIEKHIGGLSNPVDSTPQLRDAIAKGRFPRNHKIPEADMALSNEEMETMASKSAQKVLEALVGNAQVQKLEWAVDPSTGKPYPALFPVLANGDLAELARFKAECELIAACNGKTLVWDQGVPKVA